MATIYVKRRDTLHLSDWLRIDVSGSLYAHREHYHAHGISCDSLDNRLSAYNETLTIMVVSDDSETDV